MFEATQQAVDFSDAQICTFLNNHPVAPLSEPDCVLSILQVIGSLSDTSTTSNDFKETVLVAHSRLFHLNPVVLQQRVAFLYQMYGTTGINVIIFQIL